MLSVIMLSVIMLSVIMLGVIMLSVIMLNVVAPKKKLIRAELAILAMGAIEQWSTVELNIYKFAIFFFWSLKSEKRKIKPTKPKEIIQIFGLNVIKLFMSLNFEWF